MKTFQMWTGSQWLAISFEGHTHEGQDITEGTIDPSVLPLITYAMTTFADQNLKQESHPSFAAVSADTSVSIGPFQMTWNEAEDCLEITETS